MNHRVWAVQQAEGPFNELEIPCPEPQAGQALVKIAASGVCLLDTKIRAGKAAHAKQPFPAVLGLDMSEQWSRLGLVSHLSKRVMKFMEWSAVWGGCKEHLPNTLSPT